jgi:hypothetical protein
MEMVRQVYAHAPYYTQALTPFLNPLLAHNNYPRKTDERPPIHTRIRPASTPISPKTKIKSPSAGIIRRARPPTSTRASSQAAQPRRRGSAERGTADADDDCAYGQARGGRERSVALTCVRSEVRHTQLFVAHKSDWEVCVRRRWELFVPLHRLWCGYMTELLGPPTIQTLSGGGSATAAAAGMHAKLVKADFHGSIVTGTCVCVYGRSLIERYACEVRRSRNPALVGLEGIVVQETENTFKVVTRSDKLKGACVWAGVDLVQLVWMTSFVVLPKQGSVFVFGVPVAGTNSGSGRDDGDGCTACRV